MEMRNYITFLIFASSEIFGFHRIQNKLMAMLLFAALLFASCTHQVPEQAKCLLVTAKTYPDYNEAVIPYNIAPLNFLIKENKGEYLIKIFGKRGKAIIVFGQTVKIPFREWKDLLTANKGDTIFTIIYTKKDTQWFSYSAILNFVAPDAIDPYISYRLIEPSYVAYEGMSINQRNITSFKEKVLFDNRLFSKEENGQCVNCHNFRNYNREGFMQMHVRQYLGGTLIIDNKDIKKINLKTGDVISPGVYPSWHPKELFIAYSVNNTGQNFHTRDIQKIEVMDTESDIILYDVKHNEVSMVENSPNDFETFPSWSTDGKFLYYTSAHFVYAQRNDKKAMQAEIANRYDEIHYDLLRKPFNMEKRSFGKTDTIFRAAAIGKSVAFPRESPDGKYLLFTLGDFGNFHIWHKSSDLYLMNLQTRETRPMVEINSADVESYHDWSSNGRWIIFSSRRDDGSYTRPYIAWFDTTGRAHCPFILPQEDPLFYSQFLKSYNVPQFMVQPVKLSRYDFVKAIRKDAVQAKFIKVDDKQFNSVKKDKGNQNFYN
jgi:hypothetical protein